MATTLDFTHLHALRDGAEYDAAAEELGTLLDLDPAPGTTEYDRLEGLTALIAAYDAEHIRFGEDIETSPQAVVDFALDQHGMTRAQLAEVMGGRSRVSDFFNGVRALSMTQVRALRALLGIPADLLIPAD
jgi:HTH-type transcriptional regulator / antitoxin HigA